MPTMLGITADSHSEVPAFDPASIPNLSFLFDASKTAQFTMNGTVTTDIDAWTDPISGSVFSWMSGTKWTFQSMPDSGRAAVYMPTPYMTPYGQRIWDATTGNLTIVALAETTTDDRKTMMAWSQAAEGTWVSGYGKMGYELNRLLNQWRMKRATGTLNLGDVLAGVNGNLCVAMRSEVVWALRGMSKNTAPDFNATTQQCEGWINGFSDGPGVTADNNAMDPGVGYIMLGGQPNSGVAFPTTQYQYLGKVSLIAAYSRALTIAELDTLHTWLYGYGQVTPGNSLIYNTGGMPYFPATALGGTPPQPPAWVVEYAENIVSASQSGSVTFTMAPLENDVIALMFCTSVERTVTVPADWINPLGGNTLPTGQQNHTGILLLHVVTAAEALAWTKTFTVTNLINLADTGDVSAFVLRNVDPAAPVDAVTSAAATSVTITTPALNGADLLNGSYVIAAGGIDAPVFLTPPPSGWVLYTKQSHRSSLSVRIAPPTTTAGTSVPSASFKMGLSDEWSATTLALKTTTPTSPTLPTVAIAPKLWLDSDDASTFTFSSGTAVSEWRDKTANGINFNVYAGSGTLQRNVLVNGRWSVEFPDTCGLDTPGSHQLWDPTTGAATYFAAFQTDGNGGTRGLLCSTGTNGVSLLRTTLMRFDTRPGPVTASSPVLGTLYSHTYVGHGIYTGYSGSAGTMTSYLNDVAGTPVTGPVSTAVGATVIQLGKNGLNYHDGRLCEVLAYPGALSATDCTSIVNYLRVKWGAG